MRKLLTLLLFTCTFHFSEAQVSISGIVNIYTAVTSIDYCGNAVSVASTTGFSAGDRVLLIQMKGAEINMTNTASFGNLISYHEAGNYELATISSISGSSIEFANKLEKSYDVTAAVQLIRVAVYDDADIDGVLTAQNWNGSTGGVVVMEADILTFNSNIDVSAKGFRGGDAGNFPESCPSGTGTSLYYSDTLSGKGGEKGEGIVMLALAYTACRGKAVNGGGGGNDHNAGAGGGSNGAVGGSGGENDESFFSCPGSPGNASIAVDQTIATDKIFLGGGGGAGHGNNTNGTSGGNGGGIAIIIANQIIGNSYSIISNGVTVTELAWGDGAGGGGAGGSILISSPSVGSLSLEAKGGKGGDAGADQCTGPGGGGSGGVVKHSGAALWAGVSTVLTGGINGTITTATSPCFGLSNGASTGSTGIIIPFMIFAEGSTPFDPDFAYAGEDTLLCDGGSIKLEASGGISYEWTPSIYLDNPFVSDPNCSPLSTITYVLEVTDINGCIDYDTITITVAEPVIADAGTDINVCDGESVELNAGGGVSYLWSPGFYLDDITLQNPICTPLDNILYTVIVTDENGCVGIDSIFVTVSSSDFLTATTVETICLGGSETLSATGGISYVWTPSIYLDDATSSNPLCTPAEDIIYFISSFNIEGCEDVDTVFVFVSPVDFLSVSEDVSICDGGSIELNASGGDSYSWFPTTYLDDPFSANPICTPLTDITYYVSSLNVDGCADTDTITVSVGASEFAITETPPGLCIGESIGLSSTGGINYFWSPSTYLDDPFVSSPICTPLSDITYFVTIENAEGCLDIDTVDVNVFPEVNAVGGPDTTICSGEPLKLEASGGISYLWTPDTYLENDDIFNPNCFPEASISYVVYVTDINGCVGTDTVDIIVNESPVIDVSEDITICRGDTITLSAFGGTNYIWTPDPLEPCGTCENADVAPNITTDYIVQGFDANGCFDSDTVTVTVTICNSTEDILADQIIIYPNPANEVIYVNTAGLEIEMIEVVNMLGEKINADVIYNAENLEIHLHHISSQQLIILFHTNMGIAGKLITIQQ